MLFDTRDPIPAGIPADLCIVGGGPAGLVVAAALRDSGRRIVVLESGGQANEPFAQELNQGRVVGAPYDGLGSTRQRQVGGTARLWNTPVPDGAGAKYVPLAPRDFEALPSAPWSGWPFGAADLEPYYRRAQGVCGLGPFQYEAAHWGTPERPPLNSGSVPLVTGVYQFGSARLFIDRLVADLTLAENVVLYHGVTVTRLGSDHSGRRVTGLTGSTKEGATITVHPRWVVLAGGAIENARLLLLSHDSLALLDPGEWLGCCFMEHPRDYANLRFAAADGHARLRFYDRHTAGDGTVIAGRLGIESASLRRTRLPGVAVTLLPVLDRPRISLWSRLLRSGAVARPSVGYGWSEGPESRSRSCSVVLNLEQLAARENRIVLDQSLDHFALPRPCLRWTWSAAEQQELDRLRQSLREWFDAAGLGRLEFEPGKPPDLNAHHHAGTTRMHEDPRGGVVDPDLRVHGIDNLFVTGGSVFPRVGWANPMLTVVALSLRLADRLSGLLDG